MTEIAGAFIASSCAGKHLILDVWHLDPVLLRNVSLLESILKAAAAKAGATILDSFFHSFGEESGVTGTIALAESHISIHTWPEKAYAAIDIFLCGKCDPCVASNFIKGHFKDFTLNDNIVFREILLPRGVE